MKTVKKVVKISKFPIPYSLLEEIARKVINKEEVTAKLWIDTYEPYKIYVKYTMEEEPFEELDDVYFESEKLFIQYMTYYFSCKERGIQAIWEVSITDCHKREYLDSDIELSIPLIWERQENEVKEAESEAQRIIRNARARAVNERKKILESIGNSFKDMYYEKIEKEKVKLNRMSNRLEQFISSIAEKKRVGEEELLHNMLKYMTLYNNDDVVSYEAESIYKFRIKNIKRQLEYLKERCPFNKTNGSWEENKAPHPVWDLAYFYHDLSSLYAELSPKIGFKTSLAKIIEAKIKINNILKSYDMQIDPEYSSLWEKLIETKKEMEDFKQMKKEEMREERERHREEEKARKEWEKEREKAEKDEALAQKKLEEAQKELQRKQNNEEEYRKLKERIAELQKAYQKAIQRTERAISMAEQTKKGFVYIISNVNSFGENVFKIGLTRRIDPTERVDELGNASVPFPFEINALIESDDAPALEASLHRMFAEHKINKNNWRKEFFRISFNDIEKALEEKGIDASIVRKDLD